MSQRGPRIVATMAQRPAINFALGRPATQSSVSAYSTSQTPEIDAAVANNGDTESEAIFHTAHEQEPWWQVDLAECILIERVVIYNRTHCAERLRHFTLLGSLDGSVWFHLSRKSDEGVFQTYVAEIPGEALVRYVRVRLDGHDCLHFRECQVFGERPAPAVRDRLMADHDRARELRRARPPGRHGHFAELGGFSVFVDQAYDSGIRRFIDEGHYEGRERWLVRRHLLPQDRVLEAGTAIGVVAMTAASIVGAANVLTFDANPEIVADAQENFRRNALTGIDSRCGVLRARKRLSAETMVDFHIDKAFWASRLNASPKAPSVARTVQVPVFCLEEHIARHGATALICDIEGGEVDLLGDADLTGIRLIIMETHYWSTGEAATDAMFAKLIAEGFALHLADSGQQVLVLRR